MYRTGHCGAAMIATNCPSLVSNLTTKNKFDADINDNDDSQSLATPRKTNTEPLKYVI